MASQITNQMVETGETSNPHVGSEVMEGLNQMVETGETSNPHVGAEAMEGPNQMVETGETSNPHVGAEAMEGLNQMVETGDTINPHVGPEAMKGLNQMVETGEISNPHVGAEAMEGLNQMVETGETSNPHVGAEAMEGLNQMVEIGETSNPHVAAEAMEGLNQMVETGETSNPHVGAEAMEGLNQIEETTNHDAPAWVEGYARKKACHQCRQIRNVYGHCVTKKKSRTCPFMLCPPCLKNRYGEDVEEVVVNTNWLCPRCRGLCNCSGCRRKNGLDPTGPLVGTAKKSGFNDVSKYLEKSEDADKHVYKTMAKMAIASPESLGQEIYVEKNRAIVEKKEEVKLPQGIESIVVSGIDLPPEHTGSVLQFLEFCSTFGKVLNLREGQAESIVHEVLSGKNTREIFLSTLTEIIIQLLAVIVKDTGNKSMNLREFWINAIGDCLAKSVVKLDGLTPEMFKDSIHPYEELNTSQRLKLLNFLCDEALGTTVMRSCIENPEYAERKKEAKKMVKAAKYKEEQLLKKKKDELARGQLENNGILLRVDQRLGILRKMEAETEDVIGELHNALEFQKNLGYDDPLRTNPVQRYENGLVLWKLKSYKEEKPNILLQDLGSSGEVSPQEKWFAFTPEQKPDIEDFIANSKKMMRRRRRSKKTANTIDPVSEE
ncbi:unnamed protein product [Thlaspi arvense]|uniref:DDT domain-containing protein n=1 Tax=Thlaspi arvense TaxID=13288 RepID=A0AAU9RN91_THLAR|nr:unnamed protein product [Thlaspi arvense]